MLNKRAEVVKAYAELITMMKGFKKKIKNLRQALN
jgi:hypothetical protein